MFEAAAGPAHCSLERAGARWLATGVSGGTVAADVAANVTVPERFDRTDLGAYVASRRADAGLPADGPTLLTAVDAAHARGARAGSVTAVATAGLTNPATLPMEPERTDGRPNESRTDEDRPNEDRPDGGRTDPGDADCASRRRPGTVNLLVGTTRALDDGALAELLATVVEAKTATLTATVGFTGTTSDAVAVGSDPTGEAASFAGSGTAPGAATRACVRDALRASLAAWSEDRQVPDSVDAADHGAVTRMDTEPVDL